MTTWRTTKSTSELDFRCDHCGEKANTLHFVPWVGGLDTEEVLFACPKHDPGGYWVTFTRWFDPREDFPHHVWQKQGGPEALALLEQRIDQLRIAEAGGANNGS